ncbi:MAG TPA: hypothetical protein VGH78_01180 [Solirubrobacteraceae bacterium]|jgi:hypothetical protein
MTIPAHRHDDSVPRERAGPTPRATVALRAALGGLLGVLAAVLIACGSSGAGLIPAGDAGPLQSDFEAIAAAAQSGNGSCESTNAAIAKTEQDFRALPASVDSGLRRTLRQGIDNLRARALVACTQPLPQSTATSDTTKTTDTAPTTTTTPPTTNTTPPATTPTTSTPPPTTTSPGGGTPAPGGEGASGGQGGSEPGAGSGGASAGGQEGGK